MRNTFILTISLILIFIIVGCSAGSMNIKNDIPSGNKETQQPNIEETQQPDIEAKTNTELRLQSISY